MDYGDVIYKMASSTAFKKLDTLYRSAIRFATYAPLHTHHCDLYKLVGWLFLHTRGLHHWFHFAYKTILGKTPPYLLSLLHLTHNKYRTRSSEYIKLIIPPSIPLLPLDAIPFASQQQTAGTLYKTPSNSQL